MTQLGREEVREQVVETKPLAVRVQGGDEAARIGEGMEMSRGADVAGEQVAGWAIHDQDVRCRW